MLAKKILVYKLLLAHKTIRRFGVRRQNRHEDFLKKKKKDSKGATCPLVPLPTRWQKFEKFQSLPSEPPRREDGNLNRENPRA